MLRLLSFFLFRAGCWQTARRKHIERQPECAACGRSENLDVHHIVPVSKDKTKECDPENLITLCSEPCHLVHGHFMNWHLSNPDVVADCKRYREKRNVRQGR